MIRATENRDTLSAREAFIYRLLKSPAAVALAAEQGATAARERAAADLEALHARYKPRLAALRDKALEANKERDALRIKYEAAARAATSATDAFATQNSGYIQQRTELISLTSASERVLREKGLLTLTAVA